MTRAEAEQERDRLTREHPDRATHRWMARADDAGVWSVVKVGLPPTGRGFDSVVALRGSTRPPQADDPRTLHSRIVGGHWV